MKFILAISMLISALVAPVLGAPAPANSVHDPPDAPLFPPSSPSKPITDDLAPGDDATRGWPFVELFTGKDYTGDVFRLAYRDAALHTCLNVDRDILSIKLWDMDMTYWCRIYEQVDCQWDNMAYADIPGETWYFVNDLKHRWNHKLGSVQCFEGQFEEIN